MSGVEELRARLRERAAGSGRGVSVSFEFFPPADEPMEQTLWQSILRLAPLAPRFVSVTYGADGSTRERTHNVVARVLEETELTAAPHLTCIGAPREEISTSPVATGTPASATSSRCAATRRRARAATCRAPTASPTPSTWCVA